jgi:hypothetical protein
MVVVYAYRWSAYRTIYNDRGRAVVSADQYLDPTGTAVSSGPVYATRTLYDG